MSGQYQLFEEEYDPGGRRFALVFNWNGASVPAVLMLPHSDVPVPSALLIHGFRLTKEHMAASIGKELLANGIASLAIDLPLHGERYAGDFSPPATPFELTQRWNTAQQECRLALRFLSSHPGLNPEKLFLVGYSLGSFIGLKVAADNPNVRAVVLAAAGDLPDYVPFVSMIRMMADPIQWARRLKGRPLLMLHGKQDTIVPPQLAERLFRAAPEPKKILWFDAGHVLPQESMSAAADWLRDCSRQ